MRSLLVLVVALTASLAPAQASVRGEFEVGSGVTLQSTDRARTAAAGLTLRGHVEAQYRVDRVDLRVTLDPTLRLVGGRGEAALFEPGLTEAFGRYAWDAAHLSAGLERLPLETARLSVPFGIEPSSQSGQPTGVLGVRATIFLDDWRVRPAFVYRHQDDRAGGVVSVRRAFGSFELEAHALYVDGATIGLGGSGLVGDVVVYGEAWLLTNGWRGRGALGANGFWGDALWSAEVAYAPSAAGPPDDPRPQLLGQISLPYGAAGSLDVRAGWDLGGLGSERYAPRASGGLVYTYSDRDDRFTTGFTLNHAPVGTVYGFQVGVTSYF